MNGPFRNPLRHQVPAHSPLPIRGVAGAVAALLPGNGDPVRALGEHLRASYGAARVLLLGSGTQALTTALRRAGQGSDRSGDPTIALPAYTCFDVASAAVAAGRRVRFYDLDPRTLGPDPDSLRAAVRAGARVVVVAPLFGIPIDWEALDPILAEEEAVVVEDAAQGQGASWQGAPVGSRGTLSVLSFGRGKGWTGAGRGGALLLRDAGTPGASGSDVTPPPDDAASLGTIAMSGVLWALSRPGIYRLPRSLPFLGLGETHYRPPGAVAGLPRSAAAFLLASREEAAREAEVRRRHAAEYREALRNLGRGEGFSAPEGGVPGFLRFPFLLPGGMGGFRDPRRAQLLGAAPGYPRALPELEALAPLRGSEGEGDRFPGAAELVERLVTLPTHSRTKGAEREELVSLSAG